MKKSTKRVANKESGVRVGLSSSPITAVVSDRAYVYLENDIKSIDILHMGQHFTVTLPIKRMPIKSPVSSNKPPMSNKRIGKKGR